MPVVRAIFRASVMYDAETADGIALALRFSLEVGEAVANFRDEVSVCGYATDRVPLSLNREAVRTVGSEAGNRRGMSPETWAGPA